MRSIIPSCSGVTACVLSFLIDRNFKVVAHSPCSIDDAPVNRGAVILRPTLMAMLRVIGHFRPSTHYLIYKL